MMPFSNWRDLFWCRHIWERRWTHLSGWVEDRCVKCDRRLNYLPDPYLKAAQVEVDAICTALL